jgi:hypothetical protein
VYEKLYCSINENTNIQFRWVVFEFIVTLLKLWIEPCFLIHLKRTLTICYWIILNFNKSDLMAVFICARWLVYCVNIHPGGPRFTCLLGWVSDPLCLFIFLTKHSSLLYFTHSVKSDYFLFIQLYPLFKKSHLHFEGYFILTDYLNRTLCVKSSWWRLDKNNMCVQQQ